MLFIVAAVVWFLAILAFLYLPEFVAVMERRLERRPRYRVQYHRTMVSAYNLVWSVAQTGFVLTADALSKYFDHEIRRPTDSMLNPAAYYQDVRDKLKAAEREIVKFCNQHKQAIGDADHVGMVAVQRHLRHTPSA